MRNNVLIIGGGPAGLEASANLQRLGYNVLLVEHSNTLGGHLGKWDRLFPSGTPASGALDKLLGSMDGVKCFTDTEIQSINRLGKSYNVILSNGITVLADAVLVQYFKTGLDARINAPRKIGFVHCVGSRDEKSGCRSCSKVCCATAVKQACEMKAAFPDAQIYCFYMDLRMFGRHYEDMYLEAQRDYGIRFIRGRVAEVSENIDGSLSVKAEDTVSSKPLKVSLDLLVLMAGMRPSVSGQRIGSLLGMQNEKDGYFEVLSEITSQQRSPIPGIFLAGAATGPKTLPDTLADARGAATQIDKYLSDIFPKAKDLKQLIKTAW